MTKPSFESELRSRYRFLPKDFVETADGLLFAVVAPGVEEGRVLSSLRYLRRLGRLEKLTSSLALTSLRQAHPDWLFQSPSRDAALHGVPQTAILTHSMPRSFFDLCGTSVRDASIVAAIDFYRLLSKEIPQISRDLGVTGSLLIAAQHARSDIDLLVYGSSSFARLRRLIIQWLKAGVVRPLSQLDWQQVYERRGCELNFEEYVWHEVRKSNKLRFKGHRFDISCVSEPDFRAFAPGRKLGRTQIEAVVVDDRAAFDTPAVYGVRHSSVDAVVSHTPTYAGQATEGEWILVSGWLEDCGDFQRVVVGTSREAHGEFIKTVR